MASRSLKRTVQDFKRHPWLHLATLATTTLALFVLGIFLMLYRNLDFYSDRAKSQNSGTIYLKENVAEKDSNAIREKLLALPKVKAVTFKSKTSVMEELQAFLNTQIQIKSSNLDFFPDVLEIEFKAGTGTQDLEDLRLMIAQVPQVQEIDFSEDWLEKFLEIQKFVKFFGFLLLTGVVVGCCLIIANFMGVRIQARKDEIEIISLHGASSRFIMGPLFLEGLIEGFLAGIVALILLFSFRSFLNLSLTKTWVQALGFPEILFFSFSQISLLLSAGILMVLLGCFAVFLRFQE